MKKLLYLTLMGLVLMGQFHLLSCTLLRDVHKSRSHADSSSVRTEQTFEAWETQITRDYHFGGAGLGTIPTSRPEAGTSVGGSWPALPLVLNVPTPYLVRETYHQKGEKQQEKTESKQAETSERQTDRDYSPMIEKAILLFQIFLCMLGAAFLLGVYRTFIRR